MEFLILDVGCGNRPKGDVNIDLFPKATAHRPSPTRDLCSPLKLKEIPNFVKADAQYIPIRDKTFELAYSSHTIEHLDKPFQMIKEMIRVSRRRVVIICPHRYARKVPEHKQFFNIRWFAESLRILNIKRYTIKYSKWRYFPHSLIPLVRVPCEIKLQIILETKPQRKKT